MERGNIKTYPLSSAYVDTFPEGESKDKAADARHFPRRGSRECGLSIKRLFDEKMPECCSVAPHHLALQGASPQGEGTKWLTIFAEEMKFTEFFFRQGEGLQRPLQSAEADSFPEGEAKNAG